MRSQFSLRRLSYLQTTSWALAAMAVQHAALGQALEMSQNVDWNWTYSVSPTSLAETAAKAWVSNPNPVPDYKAGPFNGVGTVSASLNDPRSLPANAEITRITGTEPASSIQLTLSAQYSSSSPYAEVRDITKLFAANGVPFSLTSGGTYGYNVSGNMWFMKPQEANTQDVTVTSTFSLQLSLGASGPTSGRYTIFYRLKDNPPGPTIPEPEAVFVLAGLPLMAWGMLRRLRPSTTA